MAITSQGLKKLGFTPDVDFILQNNSDGTPTFISKWNSPNPQPSEVEIETAHAEWQAEYDSQEYARNRATAYPPIGDQLDALFHAGVFPSEMASTLQAVKDKYPKV
ncbi:MAG: XkdW family protein [Anaerolineales bacterium]|nr:XkdW family protein [Anaerolineales bacterium]